MRRGCRRGEATALSMRRRKLVITLGRGRHVRCPQRARFRGAAPRHRAAHQRPGAHAHGRRPARPVGPVDRDPEPAGAGRDDHRSRRRPDADADADPDRDPHADRDADEDARPDAVADEHAAGRPAAVPHARRDRLADALLHARARGRQGQAGQEPQPGQGRAPEPARPEHARPERRVAGRQGRRGRGRSRHDADPRSAAADAEHRRLADDRQPDLLGQRARGRPDRRPELLHREVPHPAFLLPIYQAAGIQYGIRWEVLAAINEIETDYGRNLNVSSAGALGSIQFMPSTWDIYGINANGDSQTFS